MSVFDILKLIPKSLQQEIVDGLVDVLSKQAEKVLGDQFADKIKKLRSDGAFVQAFQTGLRLAERKGNLIEAQQMCALALERFTFLGLEEGMQECRRLLDRLSG